MKNATFLAAVAAIVGFALPANAQCMSGMGLGDPGAEPVKIVMKYSWKVADMKPAALKSALEKLPTVAKASFDEKAPNRINVQFKGRCDQIGALETAAASSGVPAYVVNHAHVSIVLKTQPGADLKGAIDALGKVQGALFAKASGTSGLEIHADLNLLSMEEIRGAVAPFKCEAIVNQTFEFVRYRVVEGEAKAFEAAVNALKGVMVVHPEMNSGFGMWINKAAVKPEQIEKLEGFKLKRV